MRKIRVNVRVTELDAASDAMVRLFRAEPALAADGNLVAIMAEVEDLSARITTAIKGGGIRSRAKETDRRRDEIIRSLGALLAGYAVIPVEDKQAAARRLVAVFRKYRGITGESYVDESSLVESMLEDFSAPSLSDAVAVLEGVGTLIGDLRSAQDDFNRARDEYVRSKVEKGETASEVKSLLLSAINDRLLPYLSAVVAADGGRYGGFAAGVFAQVEKTNALIVRRGSAKKERESRPADSQP